jgi:predicted metalloprotease with PDZ domain
VSDFFKRYVRGVELLPYDEALRSVGLRLVRETSREPTVGITSDFDEQTAMRVKTVRNDSPAEEAGLEQGDVIVSVGNSSVTRDTFAPVIARYKPNDRVTLTIRRDRNTLRKAIKLGPPASYTYRIEELKEVTPEMRARRAVWLNGGRN